MNNLEQIIELKNKTIEEILNKYGSPGQNLDELKLSFTTFRLILYEEARKIAQKEFDKLWERRC